MQVTEEVSHEEPALRTLHRRFALAAILLIALGVSASTLGILAVALACPLMMFVMMRMMMGNQPATHERDDPPIGHDRPR